MRGDEDKGIVVVTGGTGYVASWLIMRLLQQGYRVRNTIRSYPGEEDQYKHLSKTSMVHVDDVASAHIFLLEHPDLKGRYICSPFEVTIDQISEFLSAKYPEYAVPRADALKGIEESKCRGLSSKKLMDSGFEFKYGFEEMFDGAIQCCKEKGLI